MRSVAIALAAVVLGACASHAADAPLPALKLDPARTTVSGLSSGAYMAQQLHLAWSDHLSGAAFVAGGPYHGAQGALQTALAQCMKPEPGKGPAVEALAGFARAAASAGRIAPLAGLADDAVLILHGTGDQTVAESLSRDSAALYRALAPQARVHEDLARDFSHTFPTATAGGACDASAPPYVGRCGFDAAQEILQALYGKPRHAVAPAATGELRRFDQNAYDGKQALLAASGYVYVPRACSGGATCALHIALHGCQQNADSVGEAFVRDAGYNRWADAYELVVLYPQTRSSLAPLNPKACWDWWGYSGADYDTREGVQPRAIAAMAAALGAPLR
ncbi:MAG: hypothetical protein IT477_06610 [Rhodanobacteraceae bacterium]|nr:hypothetical protein [Rhodanobacteraceae bacterium]